VPAALGVLLAACALAHDDSRSTSRITVTGAEVELELRVQVQSLAEVIPGLAAGPRVEASELAACRNAVLAYLGEHYRLLVGTAADASGGRALEPRPAALELVASSPDSFFPAQDWVAARLRYEGASALDDLAVEMRLFLETSPAHKDVATLVWNERGESVVVLDAGRPRWRWNPGAGGTLRAFFGMGTRHIVGGWDHLAFLLALLLASRRLRSLAAVVTAFTLAHSASLALATLEVVDVSAYSSFIEATIALSIAYVAADTCLSPDRPQARWIEAFVFGLVHGLGFAGFLAGSLVLEESKTVALFAFNLGVEAGQLALVAAAALLLRLLLGRRRAQDGFLAPRPLRRWGSAVVAILGLYWFVERVWL